MHDKVLVILIGATICLGSMLLCLKNKSGITNRDIAISLLIFAYGLLACTLIWYMDKIYSFMLPIGLVVGGLALLFLDSFPSIRKWLNKKASWLP